MATAAEPILASTLWATFAAAERISNDSAATNAVPTGCRKLDLALEGGLQRGTICCISAEPNSGGRELSQALLVSHLLGSPTATATVVDSAFSLDVRRLQDNLLSRLGGVADTEKRAQYALDRVKIMKVFDFAGVTESLAELRDALESRECFDETVHSTDTGPKGTIGDSEDEDDGEMLDVPSPAPVSVTQPSTMERNAQSTLLIIDNIGQVMARLLKNNYVQGQALLSSFMRSLSHLTRMHNLCTVLLNGTVSSHNMKEEFPSIFQSCTLQPALGKSFTYMLDIHLLVHQVADAVPSHDQNADDKITSVMEVLHDRHGGRVGKWAPFRLNNAGGLEDLT